MEYWGMLVIVTVHSRVVMGDVCAGVEWRQEKRIGEESCNYCQHWRDGERRGEQQRQEGKEGGVECGEIKNGTVGMHCYCTALVYLKKKRCFRVMTLEWDSCTSGLISEKTKKNKLAYQPTEWFKQLCFGDWAGRWCLKSLIFYDYCEYWINWVTSHPTEHHG